MFLDKMENISRRDFLRNSGLVAGAGSLGLVAGASGEVEKTKKVREFTIAEWGSDFGLRKRDNGWLIGVEEVYMENLRIGEKVIIKEDSIYGLRRMMEDVSEFTVGLQSLERRKYATTFDEVNLTCEITRQI